MLQNAILGSKDWAKTAADFCAALFLAVEELGKCTSDFGPGWRNRCS